MLYVYGSIGQSPVRDDSSLRWIYFDPVATIPFFFFLNLHVTRFRRRGVD